MYEITLERGKIREFVRATHGTPDDPADDAPTIPPTFLTTAQLTWEPPSEPGLAAVGFDLPRLLHGEEEYVFHGPPPRAGTVLTVTSRVERRFEKVGRRGGTMRFAAVVHEFRDPAGDLVAEQRSTLIETDA